MEKLGNVIPELVNAFNVYLKGNKLVGVSGEVELPELEAMTETIELAGSLGELETPATGHFSSAKMKIPFAVLHEDLFSLIDTTKPVEITLRGSMQCQDPKTGATDYYPIKIVVRGKATTTTLGVLSKGKKGEPEIELEISYIKVVINNITGLELDKLNFKYVLNGEDMLAKIRKQI